MNKDFIYFNSLVNLKFYGIVLRLDVIFIDNISSIWVVTKRTCNKQAEETWTFTDVKSGFAKFKDLVSSLHTDIFGF